MDYTPHTVEDQRQMMDVIGIHSIGDLFCDIPEKFRLSSALNLPPALSEQEVARLLKTLRIAK